MVTVGAVVRVVVRVVIAAAIIVVSFVAVVGIVDGSWVLSSSERGSSILLIIRQMICSRAARHGHRMSGKQARLKAMDDKIMEEMRREKEAPTDKMVKRKKSGNKQS